MTYRVDAYFLDKTDTALDSAPAPSFRKAVARFLDEIFFLLLLLLRFMVIVSNISSRK